MSYDYRFYIKASMEEQYKIIKLICLALEFIKNDYPLIYPQYYTCWTKKSVEKFINSTEDFKKHFKKNVLSLFSSLDEDSSCSYTFHHTPEINGYFLMSIRLPIDIDMTKKENIYMYDTMMKKMIYILNPNFAYVRTIEDKYINNVIRKKTPIYDIAHWRLYCDESIKSEIFKKSLDSNVGKIEQLNKGYLFTLSEFDMENITKHEFDFFTCID